MSESTFPQLLETGSNRSYPLQPFRDLTIGQTPAADTAQSVQPGKDSVFQVGCRDGRWLLKPLGDGTPIRVNQSVVTRTTPLEHLAVIQAAGRVFLFLARDDSDTVIGTGSKADEDVRLAAASLAAGTPDATLAMSAHDGRSLAEGIAALQASCSIELPEQPLVIGRDPGRADICLPDVRISRVHAWICRQGIQATVRDLHSSNGTFVDGQRLIHPVEITAGSQIQLGPVALVFTGTALRPLSDHKEVRLVARDLTKRIPDPNHSGRQLVILDRVSIVIQPREFVCILGPSGSGKTTLLSALSARQPPNEGCVLLNDRDLYRQFEALKQNLAVVPQHDVMHDVLTLNQALRYTARLRLPADTSCRDIDARIDEMLESVRLLAYRCVPIRQLSGGQIRRAGWVNEAICNPSMIFLDEVTSGLDEQADAEMMQLFRQVADGGKTVVCTTHSVSHVESNCHQVVVLAAGGVLAFFGPPDEALEYFGVLRLGDIYRRLLDKPSQQWQEEYLASAACQKHVRQRMPKQQDSAPSAPVRHRMRLAGRWRAGWRQFWLLLSRNLAIQWVDKRALAMMAGQSLLVAFLLIWLFGDLSSLDATAEAQRLGELAAPGIHWDELLPESQEEFLAEAEIGRRTDSSSRLLFLLCISCIWFGCNNAAKEIVKERNIYHKERDVGMSPRSYYASKLVLLAAFSSVQSLLLYSLVRTATRLDGDPVQQWFLLSLASVVGVSLGLMISATARTSDLATTIVPISLIPQIILAGLIAPLSETTQTFARAAISAYWAYQGSLLSLDDEMQRRLHDAGYLDLPSGFALREVTIVLLIHVTLLAAVAQFALSRREA